MHLVFLNQYYPPDAAPTGVMLAAVVEELVAQGHAVTVICAEGGYADLRHRTGREKTKDEERDGALTIVRVGATRFGRGGFIGKLVDYFSYYVGVAWRMAWMRPRPERIVALTTPPYLSVLARVMSKFRGADHAHWVMDLYPDVMVAHGMLREGCRAHRILAGLARWGTGGERCAAVLTLGPDMAERLAGPRSSAPDWVPLWSGEHAGEEDGMALANRRHEMGWADDELVVMYSGNMGLGHRFGEILEVVENNIEHRSEEGAPRFIENFPPTRYVFFGGGKRRSEIAEFMARHPGLPVELHDYAPAEMLAVHLRSADVHLVSLDGNWTGTMVPSKLQGIFSAGRPVIFIGDARSSIGRWVMESGGGWWVAPGDVAGLAAALHQARDPGARETRGRAAAEFAAAHFDRNTNVRRVAGVLARESPAGALRRGADQ